MAEIHFFLFLNLNIISFKVKRRYRIFRKNRHVDSQWFIGDICRVQIHYREDQKLPGDENHRILLMLKNWFFDNSSRQA